MLETPYNLLAEQLVGVTIDGVAKRLSLPEVLAALVCGEPLEFAALQPYQFHAWHAFLVQLAAIAAYREGLDDVSAIDTPERWMAALRALSSGHDEPWSLVVPDLAQPAFMQPPVPEGSLANWNRDNATAAPDAIDLLETAKNHDVKSSRIAAPRPEHWLFALVSLQTMQGYSGQKNYGIARMNGGVSNRPAFAAAHDLSWPTRFLRDANLLFETRGEIARDHGFDPETGRALLWLEPWDGDGQLAVTDLDPFFIEICRRIRLVTDGGRVVARWTTTRAPRIAAKEQKGDLGDPWVPVKRAEGAALTARSLDYELVQRVLFGDDFRPSPASVPHPDDGQEPILSCQLMARDQGKTGGYFERFIPLPPKARRRLATPDGRRQLGELSRQRLDAIKDVASRVLRPALAALLQGGPEKLDFRDPKIAPFVEPFERDVDRVFFAQLFADLDLDAELVRRKWLGELLGFARDALEAAKASAPVPSSRVYRARAAADRVFNGAAYRMRAAAGEFIEQEGGRDEPTTE